MNKLVSFLSLIFLAGAPLLAQDDDTALGSTVNPSGPAVPAALHEADYVGKPRPKTKAKLYFLYKSHSRCGHCVNAMKTLIPTYKKMSKKDVELVMLNGDPDVATAEAWLKREKCNFPVVAPGKGQLDIPFPFDMSKAGMLPLMVAVNADGEPLGQASGAEVGNFVAENWKSMLSDINKAEKKAKAEAKKAAKKKAKAKKAADEEDADEAAEDALEDEEEEADTKKKSKKRKTRKSKKDADDSDF